MLNDELRAVYFAAGELPDNVEVKFGRYGMVTFVTKNDNLTTDNLDHALAIIEILKGDK